MPNTSIGASLDQRSLSLQLQLGKEAAYRGGGQGAVTAGGTQVGGVNPSAEIARYELNVQILASSTEVSIQAGDQSQALLFRSAIDRINEYLAPSLGPDAIQARAAEDNSPEATAARILSLVTGFFDAYASQRAGEDFGQVAEDFVDLVRSGFEKGFNEAKEILQGLQVFSGEVEIGITMTYELVNKGFDDFLAKKLTPTTDVPKAAE